MDDTRRAESPPLRWNDILRALREASGVTQDGWSAYLGYSRTTIQRWERGAFVPDAAAEQALLAVLREKGLLRTYRHGALAGVTVNEDLLRDAFAEGRAGAAPAVGATAPSTDARPPRRTRQRQPDPTRTNLSASHTSFVGRDEERTTVCRLLERSRLVTLTGTGGVGKTRLAIETAAGLVDHYAGGVWLVELAALSDPALIAQATAQALGVREAPNTPIVDSLVEVLSERPCLLLLDNCEHLIAGAAAFVETLLRRCPAVRILATSRAALGVIGETVWWVPSLPIPEATAAVGLPRHTAAGVLNAPAGRLFHDRAEAAHPAFALTDDNAAAVAAICRRLDGLPLAIELAAARARILTPAQIAAHLDERLRLLTSGAHDAPTRQQTLRGALDWSHDLLSVPAQALFRRLSVFAGGCAIDAVEAVCLDETVTRGAVFGLLAGLVEHSLLVVEYRGETARYRLLETVREYAAELLDAAGEVEDTRKRLAGWALALAERAAPHLVGHDQAAWLPRMETEHDNLRAVLQWTLDSGEVAIGLRLSGLLWRFWQVRGHLTEGRGWLDRLLARADGTPPSVHAASLLGAGALAFEQGDLAAADAYIERSVALAQDADVGVEAEAVLLLGALAWRRSDYAAASVHCEESLAVARAADDRRVIARCLNLLGLMDLDQGRYPDAHRRFEEALAIARALGDLRTSTVLLSNLGLTAHRTEVYHRARSYLEEALDLNRRLGNPTEILRNLTALAYVVRALDDTDAALPAAEEALALARAVQNRHGISEALNQLGPIMRERGDLRAALAYSAEHLRTAQGVGNPVQIMAAVSEASENARAGGDAARAVRLLAAAEAYREAIALAQHPAMQRIIEERIAALRDSIGDAAFAAAWAEGAAMTADQACAYALSHAPEPTSPAH